jgi:hypothetical protein
MKPLSRVGERGRGGEATPPLPPRALSEALGGGAVPKAHHGALPTMPSLGSPTATFLSMRRLVESGVAGADEPPERGSSLLDDPRHGV